MACLVVVPGKIWTEVTDSITYSWKKQERIDRFCSKFHCSFVHINTCSPFNVDCMFESDEDATFFRLKYL